MRHQHIQCTLEQSACVSKQNYTLLYSHRVLLGDGAFPVFQPNVSRPAETTVISVGRVKDTHLYHDCTKWFKLDLIKKKKSTFVLGNENPTRFPRFGNLCFADFLKSITLPSKYNVDQSILASSANPLAFSRTQVSHEKESTECGTDRKENFQRKIKTGLC